jgi:hypothetical protein
LPCPVAAQGIHRDAVESCLALPTKLEAEYDAIAAFQQWRADPGVNA